jgi:hypothetical protein
MAWLDDIYESYLEALPLGHEPPFYGLFSSSYAVIAGDALIAPANRSAIICSLQERAPLAPPDAIWLLIVAGLAGLRGGNRFYSLVWPVLKAFGAESVHIRHRLALAIAGLPACDSAGFSIPAIQRRDATSVCMTWAGVFAIAFCSLAVRNHHWPRVCERQGQ